MAYEFGPKARKTDSYINSLKDLLWKNKALSLEDVPHYRAIDELRLLNNAIKHEGVVTQELSKAFTRWKMGSPLNGLDKAYERLRPRVPTCILRLAESMKVRYRS